MHRFRSTRPISATELIARRFRMIRIDRSQGAQALAVQALEEVASLARGWRHDPPETLPYALRQTAAALEQAQPAMGSFLRWAYDLRGLAQSGPPNRRLRKAQHWIRRERSRLRREPAGLIRTCRRRFPEARIVVTLSRSRSVLLALKAPPAGRRPGRIVVLESLPGGEGRLFAKDLDIAGLSARCIADRAGPDAVAASDLLIVGADAVFADGSVVHKVGTRILAETARRAGVPVVVVAGSSKFTGRYRPRRALPLRFDLTPPRFITEFWTDRGVRTFASQRRPRRAAL